MDVFKMYIEKLEPLYLGQHTETGVYRVEINMEQWMVAYPEITHYELFVTSPENKIYPAATDIAGNTLIWDVNASDTAIVGKGKYQIIGIKDGKAVKYSKEEVIEVFANMEGLTDSEEAPDYAKPWVEEVAKEAQFVAEAVEQVAGTAPYIGANGNWYTYFKSVNAYVDTGVSAKGTQGEKGDKGDRGERGYTGATGPVGPQGEKGTKGEKGDKGDKGDTGAPGAKGDQGPKGDKGEKGETGAKGDPGYTPQKGVDYRDGENGADGLDGKDGFTPKVTLERVDGGVKITATNKDEDPHSQVVNDGVSTTTTFQVNVDSEFVADKTQTEVRAAMAEGKLVYMSIPSWNMLLMCEGEKAYNNSADTYPYFVTPVYENKYGTKLISNAYLLNDNTVARELNKVFSSQTVNSLTLKKGNETIFFNGSSAREFEIPDVFIVTIDDLMNADKTQEEVIQAAKDGKHIVMLYPSEGLTFLYTGEHKNWLIDNAVCPQFATPVYHTDTGEHKYSVAFLKSDGKITFSKNISVQGITSKYLTLKKGNYEVVFNGGEKKDVEIPDDFLIVRMSWDEDKSEYVIDKSIALIESEIISGKVLMLVNSDFNETFMYTGLTNHNSEQCHTFVAPLQKDASGNNVIDTVYINSDGVVDFFSYVVNGGSGSGSTSGEPHQMLVTDADGNTVWEDRTHYSEIAQVEVYAEHSPIYDETEGCAYDGEPFITRPVSGGEYTVTWNGVDYVCVGDEFEMDGMTIVALGNTSVIGGNLTTDDPFCIMVVPSDLSETMGGLTSIVYPFDGSTEITLKVNGVAEVVHKIPDKYMQETKNSFIINGSAQNSLRSFGSKLEDSEYSIGNSSVSLGQNTSVSGEFSVAFGLNTHVGGSHSFAAGAAVNVPGAHSAAFGSNNDVSGERSFTAGMSNNVSGSSNAAFGNNLTASGACQFVIGKNNAPDATKAFIIGGGTASVPVNIYTVDKDGNTFSAGTMEGTALILKSSTEGSSKRFKVTIDDNRTLTIEEIT